MDLEKIDTCQEPVRSGVKAIAEELKRDDSYGFELAPAYYLISKFDPDMAGTFLENYSKENLEIDFHLGPLELPFLAKLERDHEEGDLQRQGLIELRDQVISRQQIRGPIGGNDGTLHNTPGFFWFLSQFRGISRLEPTIDYLLSEEFIDTADIADLAVTILALCDLGYYRFEEEIKQIGDRFLEQLQEIMPKEWKDPYRSSRILMALPRLPQNPSDIVSKIAKDVIQYREEVDDWVWETDHFLDQIGSSMNVEILIGLVSAGYGQKVSMEQVRWKRKIREQRRQRSTPEFVTTLPSTRFKTRRMEIHEGMKRIIKSSQDSLLISSLQMDMLHDEIIDRLHTTEDLSIRILTNTGTASGPRTKMKKAVMNEMVERLDGKVREDRLLHTRMIIGDHEQVLISSADLTRDQLQDSFNAGIHTRDSEVVNQAVEFFNKMWEEAEPRGKKN